MSAQSPLTSIAGRAYPLPKCLPAALTSLDPLYQTRKPVRSNPAQAPPLLASLPVVQQPFCQSPVDPARWRSAVPPGYQLVRSPFALRVPWKSGHERHSRSCLQCLRCCCIQLELVRCLPPPPLTGALGAAVRDVKRRKLSGHPALPDERAGAVRAGHRGQCQA